MDTDDENPRGLLTSTFSPRSTNRSDTEGSPARCGFIHGENQETINTTHALCTSDAKVRWADLVDSEDEAHWQTARCTRSEEECCNDLHLDMQISASTRHGQFASNAIRESSNFAKTSSAGADGNHEEFGGVATVEDTLFRKRTSRPLNSGSNSLDTQARRDSVVNSLPRRVSLRDAGKATSKFRKSKRQCQYFIGIEEEPTFRVVRHILGPAGAHVKGIAAKTGAKLRLRGRGSRFLEGPEQIESADELMLCISCETADGYERAKELVRQHLEGIYVRYRTFCKQMGKSETQVLIRMHEGVRDGAF